MTRFSLERAFIQTDFLSFLFVHINIVYHVNVVVICQLDHRPFGLWSKQRTTMEVEIVHGTTHDRSIHSTYDEATQVHRLHSDRDSGACFRTIRALSLTSRRPSLGPYQWLSNVQWCMVGYGQLKLVVSIVTCLYYLKVKRCKLYGIHCPTVPLRGRVLYVA